MTAYRTTTISCNFPDCYTRYESFSDSIPQARAEAASKGWTNIGKLIDLCGPDNSATSNKLTTWQDHASRTDHQPTIGKSIKGFVGLGCICGWTYKGSEWNPEGASTRDGARLWWAKHVKEALAAAATAQES